MGLNVAHDATLPGAELAGLSVQEIVIDSAVQLIRIHRIDPILLAPVFALKARDRVLVDLLLVSLTLPKRCPDPRDYFATERQSIQAQV